MVGRRALQLLRRPGPQPGQRVDLALRRRVRQARPQVRRRDRAQLGPQPVRLHGRALLLRLHRVLPEGAVPRLRLRLRLRGPERARVALRPGLLEAHREAHHQRRRPRGLRSRPQPRARQDRVQQHQLGPADRLRLRRDGRRQDGAQGPLRPVLRGHATSTSTTRAMPGLHRLRRLLLRPGGREVRPARELLLGVLAPPLPDLRGRPGHEAAPGRRVDGRHRAGAHQRPAPLRHRDVARGQERPGIGVPRRPLDAQRCHQRPHRPAPDRLPVGQPRGVRNDAAARPTPTASSTATRPATLSAPRGPSGSTRG